MKRENVKSVRGRGQVLVLAAVLIPLLLLFFLLALGWAAVLDARAHGEYALGVATRAGARRVQYSAYGQGGTAFASGVVEEEVKDVLAQALALRTTGLAGGVGEIAADVEVTVGYGRPGALWTSPYTGQEHAYPTVAAQVPLPVKVWMFEFTLTIRSETEVR